MAAWQAGPPVRAAVVWDLLNDKIRSQISAPLHEYVAPKYLRLAMGGSHSVYILMRINLHHVGRTLFNYAARLRLDGNGADSEDAVQQPLEDPYWGEDSTRIGKQGNTCVEWAWLEEVSTRWMDGLRQSEDPSALIAVFS